MQDTPVKPEYDIDASLGLIFFTRNPYAVI